MKPSKIPVNRIVAFAGPYIAVISGWLANWLIVRVHLLTEFNVKKDSIESVLAQGIVFGLTALLVWAGHQKWLTGWQLFENTVAGEAANGPDMPQDLHPSAQPPYDPATAGSDVGIAAPVGDEELPMTDEEIAEAQAAETIPSPSVPPAPPASPPTA